MNDDFIGTMGGRTGDLDPITTCVGSTNGTKYQGNLILRNKRRIQY